MAAAMTMLLFILLVRFGSTITTATSNVTTSPKKFTAILVFGDSTVDSGNNNYLLLTVVKANFYPYGLDFLGQVPTGRFSNGKLVPDFLASALGIKETVPPFLQPDISDEALLTGVCFASAGSGYDELTTVISGAIPIPKQLEYFQDYIERIYTRFGGEKAASVVAGALVTISAGTNDFIFNYYDIPTRRFQFSISDYQDFLQNELQKLIKELYNLGCRTMLVAGVPPIGCLPVQLTVKRPISRRCIEKENSDSQSYNDKLIKLLQRLQQTLPGSKILYADVYTPILDMITNPQNYGFVETKRGCCGTGKLETGPLCNELSPVCFNHSQYIFWDSFHAAQSTYGYLANQLEKELLSNSTQIDHAH